MFQALACLFVAFSRILQWLDEWRSFTFFSAQVFHIPHNEAASAGTTSVVGKPPQNGIFNHSKATEKTLK